MAFGLRHQVGELLEQEQPLVAGALKVPDVGHALLLSAGLADGTVQVEDP